MAQKPKQKEISGRYRQTVQGYRRPRLFRVMRMVCFTLAVLFSLGALAWFHFRAHEEQRFFSSGTLSANHARFEQRCEVCHVDAEPDLLKGLRPGTTAGLFKAAFALAPMKMEERAKSVEDALADRTASLGKLDQACLRCHDPQSLHQPQAAAFRVSKAAPELAVVHSGSCTSCHREHHGPAEMAAPSTSNCVDCHGSSVKLAENLKLVKTHAKPIPPTGEINNDLGDGVRRFFAPAPTPHIPVVFTGFASGHPRFDYETPGVRNTSRLKYNHQRHDQPDVVLDGRRLICADCHRPGADGVYMQPVRYQDHCAKCHSLQFDPALPKLLAPHRDPEKVHDFVRSLTAQYMNYVKLNAPEITTEDQERQFIRQHLQQLNDHYHSYEVLERAIFYGDPEVEDEETRPGGAAFTPRSNKSQLVIGCVKCHEGVATLTPPGAGAAATTPAVNYVVPPTNMAERWINRGPFTHAQHVHVQCADCHAGAQARPDVKGVSLMRNKDLLSEMLPTQRSCTECHRPIDRSAAMVSPEESAPMKAGEDLAMQQRREGGVSAECQACHPRYHTSPMTLQMVKAAGL